MALGARRGRLVRQLLTESFVLAVCGGLVGLAVAAGLTSALLALAAGELPRASEVRLDGAVLGFSLLLSMVTGLLFGLIPAWRTSSWNVHHMLREGGRGAVGADSGRLRTGLIVAEVALAVILVVGAGLMGRSFIALMDVDPGFQPDKLIAVQFTINTARYPSPAPPPSSPGSPPPRPGPAPYTRFYTQVIEKVRTVPGIVSAAAVKDPPFRGNGERNGFTIPGRPVPAGQDAPSATMIHVSDGYFKTIGARIVDGREFTPQDRFDAPLVVVVNEAFARQFFPGDPGGRAAPDARRAGRDRRRRQRHPSGRDGRARTSDDVPAQPAELAREDHDRRAHAGRPARDGRCDPRGRVGDRSSAADHGRFSRSTNRSAARWPAPGS